MIEKMDTPFEESKNLASSRDFEEPWTSIFARD